MFIFWFLFQTEQFTVLWVLFAIIVLGNSAVLVTMFLNKSQKSRMNFFIKQLALAGKSNFMMSFVSPTYRPKAIGHFGSS